MKTLNRIFILVLLGVFALPTNAAATGLVNQLATSAPRVVDVAAGKSVLLQSLLDVSRISVASPELAEIMMLTPRDVYVMGKAPGATTLTLWGDNERLLSVYEIRVTPDISGLKEMLHSIIPDENSIQVLSAQGSVTLAGSVRSSKNINTALSIAEQFAPGKVVNLMGVSGQHQIMLEVRVAEMSRSLMRRLGVNFNYLEAGGSLLTGGAFYSFLNQLTGFDDQGRFVLSNNVGPAFSFNVGGTTWGGFLDALKTNGLIRILAEPNLICMSGQEANFLAGGEIPVPIPQGLGTVAIDWKSFGVGLKFKPTVLAGDRINLEVHPEVSELDPSNALVMDGYTIPAVTTRRVSTTVDLAPGQSFAIAGLLHNNLREVVDKYPWVGDVPVLGTLFRSSEFQKDESELVIIVTPHMVNPVDGDKLALPTDDYEEPSEFEQFLLGRVEARGRVPGTPIVEPASADTSELPFHPSSAESVIPGASGTPSGFDGDFGHALPR